jgi:hypothetical protein
MGFHLGHGNDEVMAEHCAWEKKMAQASIVCAELDLNQLISVQINKGNMLFGEFVLEPTFKKYKLCVPLVPRAFSHGDRASAEPPEALRSGSD